MHEQNIQLITENAFLSLQLVLWINQMFLLQEDLVCEGSLSVTFMSLRGTGPLVIKMDPSGQVSVRNTSVNYQVHR